MSPEDLANAYLRWLPHTPEISAAEEALLGRGIVLGKIRMRWAISRCQVVHQSAAALSECVLSGSLKPEEVVDLRGQTEIGRRFADIVTLSGDGPRVARLIRRTPFLEIHWEAFRRDIKDAAPHEPALWDILDQVNRGRQSASTAAKTLVRANLRIAAMYATQHDDDGLNFRDLIRAARLGLARATHTFDYRSGPRLLTYAKPYIRHAIWDTARLLGPDPVTAPAISMPSRWVN